MFYRLDKVATEMNLDTKSVVEYLCERGFIVTDESTSMISVDMYNLLLQKFGNTWVINDYTSYECNEVFIDEPKVDENVVSILEQSTETVSNERIEKLNESDIAKKEAIEMALFGIAFIGFISVIGEIISKVEKLDIQSGTDFKNFNSGRNPEYEGQFNHGYSQFTYANSDAIFMSNGDYENEPGGHESKRRVIGYPYDSAGKMKVDQGSGRIKREGNLGLGWQDSGRRVNTDTGRIQDEGDYGISWTDSDERVNVETGVIQKQGDWGISWMDTGTRIDPESGIIQKDGLFGWNDTDRRIDPDTGKSQHSGGLFGMWIDD